MLRPERLSKSIIFAIKIKNLPRVATECALKSNRINIWLQNFKIRKSKKSDGRLLCCLANKWRQRLDNAHNASLRSSKKSKMTNNWLTGKWTANASNKLMIQRNKFPLPNSAFFVDACLRETDNAKSSKTNTLPMSYRYCLVDKYFCSNCSKINGNEDEMDRESIIVSKCSKLYALILRDSVFSSNE